MPRYCRYFSFHAPGRSATGRWPSKQGLLQLEADEDVQVVRGFVGLDADQRRPHVVDGEVEGVQRNVAQRGGKMPLGLRDRNAPRRPGCGRPGSPTSAIATRGCPAKRPRPAAGRNAPAAGPARKCRGPTSCKMPKKAALKNVLVVTRGDAAVVRARAWCRTDGPSRRAARG